MFHNHLQQPINQSQLILVFKICMIFRIPNFIFVLMKSKKVLHLSRSSSKTVVTSLKYLHKMQKLCVNPSSDSLISAQTTRFSKKFLAVLPTFVIRYSHFGINPLSHNLVRNSSYVIYLALISSSFKFGLHFLKLRRWDNL